MFWRNNNKRNDVFIWDIDMGNTNIYSIMHELLPVIRCIIFADGVNKI